MGLPFKHKIYFIYHVVGTWAVVVKGYPPTIRRSTTAEKAQAEPGSGRGCNVLPPAVGEEKTTTGDRSKHALWERVREFNNY